MPEHTSLLAVAVFLAFVGFTLGLSFWLGRKAKTAGGYFAAHGEIGWFVNGIAFAGDYLSAASFLGICGMIAFYGYDGFLYSIGFLAGWVVALFVIAEPIKRLGRYTFADALDAKFNSPGIRLAAALSTLVVSVFYLIPQMVGAGSLIVPLLGLPHWAGVIIVGTVVILIVTTAGMVSTTWVQFIKGSLLVVFCAVLVGLILQRGVAVNDERSARLVEAERLRRAFGQSPIVGDETLRATTLAKIKVIEDEVKQFPSSYSEPKRSGRVETWSFGHYNEIPAIESGPLSPFSFLAVIKRSSVLYEKKAEAAVPAWWLTKSGTTTLPAQQAGTIWTSELKAGSNLLLPGGYFKGIRGTTLAGKLDFISLMLALFCGTASLPHILIRYYTVKDAAAARKSTVVGIAAIGFFYVLTLYIGLGAMVSGNLDPADSNMAAPLLAKTFGDLPFALITAIAFTTVLGTVSGLILAAAGAVAHDLAGLLAGPKLTGAQQVKVAKFASVGVGLVAVVLGILCQKFNVAFLVAWAFNVAAAGNLPAIVMLLFWRGTTRQGMISSILFGCLGSTLWLLLTKEAFQNVYGQTTHLGLMPFSQPGLVMIPASFVVLVAVSMLTRRAEPRGFDVAPA